MKLIYSIIFLATFTVFSLLAQVKPAGVRPSQSVAKVINSNWTFNYFPSDAAGKGYESPSYDDSKWFAVSIPHTWQTYETTGELNLFNTNASEPNTYWWNGWGWYRKHFSINQAYAGKKVFVEFEGVQQTCKVWLNGVFLGEHRDDNGSFGFDITNDIKKNGDNVIAVAVRNPGNENSAINASSSVLNNVYGGIVGNVTISLRNHLFISILGSSWDKGGIIITPEISKGSGIVRIQTRVNNDNPDSRNCVLQTSVYDAANKLIQQVRSVADIEPSGHKQFDQTTKPVKSPRLWKPDNPYLYKVIIEALDGKNVVDSYTTFFGFGQEDGLMKPPHIWNDKEEYQWVIDGARKVSTGGNANAGKGLSGLNSSGEPAKIVLKASQSKISADRGSVAIILAEIVDSKGNSVKGTNTLKWTINGPATLAGPSLFVPGGWYNGTPVANAIRSTGEAGFIKVVVFGSGLASGSATIISEAIQTDNSVISEPVLRNEGRTGPDRAVLRSRRLEEVPREIKYSTDGIKVTATGMSGYKIAIRELIVKNNPAIDTSSVEFRTLAGVLASCLANNNGQMIADDYNFNVDHFNTCRLISQYINATKLPPPFREGLRVYYSHDLIREGNEKDPGEEMNWLNWMPSGGTVVYFDAQVKTPVNGTLITTKNELAEIIALVHPGFEKFSDDARERAIGFIAKMNPYVRNEATSVDMDGRTVTNTRYFAEKGKPVLIPLLKFIAE